MNILDDTDVILAEFNEELQKRSSIFSCGNTDLDDFFNNEALIYKESLMGKTYCFIKKQDDNVNQNSDHTFTIVAAFTVSNDSLKISDLPNNRKKKMTDKTHKHLKRYSGVLIGRLGVNKDFCGKGIGSAVLNYVKDWFSEPENKTGCRYVIVDALNSEKVLKFYLNNEFKFLFSSEKQEAEYENKESKDTETPKTRLMYYDLLGLST